MRGAFDEASLRLARALRRPPEHVEAALQHVGVDAPYLARALMDGDPQGAISEVSSRLGLQRREFVTALIRSSGATGDASRHMADMLDAPPTGAPPAEARGVRALLASRLPRVLNHAALAALVAGAGLVAFASLALWRPTLFREVLFYAVAGVVALVGALFVLAAWRLRRAARGLRRMKALADDASTKRL